MAVGARIKPKVKGSIDIVEDSDMLMEDPSDMEMEESDISMDFTAKSSPAQSTYIRTKVDHKCSIGGVRYEFKKGVRVSVPMNVKNILFKADLLMPM